MTTFALRIFFATTLRQEEAAEFVRKAALDAKPLTDPSGLTNSLYYKALMQLRLGDEAGYRANCRALFDVRSYQRLFLAMTKWQLGQRDEARRLLAEIQTAVDQELQSPSIVWNRRATLEVLRREAEALIEQEEADEAVENRSRTSDEPE